MLITILVVVALLAAVHVPLGNYIAHVYTTDRHWRAERVVYRLGRIDPDADQPWSSCSGLAGAFARQNTRPKSLGTLKTHTPLFVGFTTSVAILTSLLSFLPALALGPLADAL